MSKYEVYKSLDYPLPEHNLGWNLYGAGMENMGRGGKPENFPIPEPGDDGMLVRIDGVGICFSDIKVLKQGRQHPKLYNRDMTIEPTRLGLEVALTIIKVGKNLADQFKRGQRFSVQPDVYQQGKSTAYGYTVPGGLIQYHIIGKELLETDTGVCLLPLADAMGYAESSLLEPWGCVMAAYTQRRRLYPLGGGTMWIIGQPGDATEFSFTTGLDNPAKVVVTDAPESILKSLAEHAQLEVIHRDGIAPEDYPALSEALTGGKGFDDIVVLNPGSA